MSALRQLGRLFLEFWAWCEEDRRMSEAELLRRAKALEGTPPRIVA